eukprot:Polyplicarium_translucidae@DN5180_c0_g1_i1.p2
MTAGRITRSAQLHTPTHPTVLSAPDTAWGGGQPRLQRRLPRGTGAVLDAARRRDGLQRPTRWKDGAPPSRPDEEEDATRTGNPVAQCRPSPAAEDLSAPRPAIARRRGARTPWGSNGETMKRAGRQARAAPGSGGPPAGGRLDRMHGIGTRYPIL